MVEWLPPSYTLALWKTAPPCPARELLYDLIRVYLNLAGADREGALAAAIAADTRSYEPTMFAEAARVSARAGGSMPRHAMPRTMPAVLWGTTNRRTKRVGESGGEWQGEWEEGDAHSGVPGRSGGEDEERSA